LISSKISHGPTQKYTDGFFLKQIVCVRLWIVILNQLLKSFQ